MSDWIALATIAQPHGVRGQLKVNSLTDPVEQFAAYDALCLENGTRIKLQIKGRVQQQLIIQIDGVHSREEAERWRGKQLGVSKAELPALSEQEFYHAELVGMRIVSDTGADLGVVKQVANYGAGDLLEIEQDGRTEFCSFTNANFPRVDRAARVIEFHPPDILAGKPEAEDAE